MFDLEQQMWTWPKFNPPGLLVGPLPHVKHRNYFVPDYRYPGVAERVRVEVDFIEFICDGSHR